MSLSRALSERTCDAIVSRFGLVEATDSTLELTSQMSPDPVGVLRLWGGEPLARMVYVGLTVGAIGLDSHMLFAFTPAGSPVPHFTLDSVAAGPAYAFHIDLIPRVDLGANLDYMDAVFGPLSEVFDAVRRSPGLEAAHLGPRQLALMSPWMLAYRADEAAFRAIDEPLAAYLDRWFRLVEDGVPGEWDEAALAERDRRNRAALFSPEVDPVWERVDKLVGADASARIREELTSQEQP